MSALGALAWHAFTVAPSGAHDTSEAQPSGQEVDATGGREHSASPEEGMTILVQGHAAEPITASSAVVTARELAAVPKRSAEDALRLVPGITLIQHGSEGKGYQFLVRGFDAMHGADLEVTAEGIPLNEWSNVHGQGYLDLAFIIPEVIETVEVTKGPFTLGQGAFAMAGSAEYHLGIAAEDRGLRASYTLGTSQRHRGVVTYGPSRSGHDFIASETLYDAGFGSRRGVAKGNLLARADLLDSERAGRLAVLVSAQVARFELPGALRADDEAAGRVGFYDSYEPTSQGSSSRGLASLDYELVREEHTTRASAYASVRRLRISENFTGYLFDQRYGDRRTQHQNTDSAGLRLTSTRRLLAGLNVELLLGVHADHLDQSQLGTDADERSISRERRLVGWQALGHAAAGISYWPVRSLRVDAGARVDVAHVAVRDRLTESSPQGGTLPALSPRATLEWRVTSSLRLLSAYGRGFRPPEARAFTGFTPAQLGVTEESFAGGEPAMTTSDSFELGTRARLGRYLSSQLNVFATFIARESVFDHVSGLNLELNSTRRLGAELSLRATPREWLTLHADATCVDARFVASGNAVPFAPALFGSLRAALGRSLGPRAGLRALGVAPRPLPHGATSSSFVRLDATAGYHFQHFRVDLEVENVLDQRLREGEYHFASHWQRSGSPSNLPTLHYFAAAPLDARLTLTLLH